MRGSNTGIALTTDWKVLLSTTAGETGPGMAADAPATAFGLEAAAANSTRIMVRWTHGSNRANLGSLAAGGDYKAFKAGKNQVVKVEVAMESGTGTVYFDLLEDVN